jgi:integrase
MSGLFSAACNRGLIATNPIRETRIDTRMKPPKPTESYSLREVEDMISALKDRPDLQLLVALCGFLGLRPSEASGLAWDCVDLTTGHCTSGGEWFGTSWAISKLSEARPVCR